MATEAKWLLCALLVVSVCLVDSFNKNKRNKEVMPHATKCFKKFHPPQDDIKRAMSGNCMQSKQGKLLMECTMQDMGLVSKDAVANMENVKKFIATVASNKQERQTLEKSAATCDDKVSTSKQSKSEEKVAEFCECLHSIGAF